jgi:uncharacterized protein YndB with AHSA1/START domain
MKLWIAALAGCFALCTAGGATAAEPAKAQSWRDFPGVENSSFVEPGGGRVLQLSAVVQAPPQQVWEAFVTDAGWTSWASPVGFVELKIGGAIESSYSPDARKGDPNNIINRIEAYVPGRLLVIRNVQAPAGFPGAEAFGKTVTVLEFTPQGAGATRVVLSNIGYGQGADFDTVYGHFEWGNAYALDGLQRRFRDGPVNWKDVFEKARAAQASKTMEGN